MDSLEPAKGTCNWLIKHELFMQWFENPKGFLWIRGKPGSGKSMAMKHALMHMKSVANSDEVVASYFIHGQGLDVQKSVLGLYRSLLHQIYPYSSKSFSSLTERYEKYIRDAGESTQDAKWSWMEGEIRQCLLDGLPKACKRIPITIFVDALDEAGEVQAKKIFKDLEVLVSSSSDAACQLRACVSCRHYPDIALNSGMTLVMEDLNGPDIASVLRTQIDALDLFNDAEKSSIKMEVLRRSEGVFQWTSLVTEAIIRTRERGDSFKVSLKHMDRVPRSLDLLYKALLEAEDELTPKHEIQQRCKLFQWVLLSARPLSPQELQHALALDREMTYRSIYDYTNSDEFITKKNLRTKIKNLSKGLIQLKGTFETGRAEFIHQSVLDFLRNSSGLQMLSGNSTMEAGQLGHFEISRRCLRYLFMAEIENVLYSLRNYDFGFNETRDPSTPVGWIGVEFPFIAYAWRYWIFHAVSAHQEGIGEEDLNIDLLKLFQWPNDQLVIQRWRPLCGFIGSPLQAWFEAFHGQSRSHELWR
ncbi:hypothetical protein SLS56_008393 [Neofusicoccum ribis]|uniref:Nephrocystin 3-like N-terminal domain-containing protein n=1 Tax=Neofusicoccum ribis TaxID=45134 RepID=A0ABR3SLM0_9PEZI